MEERDHIIRAIADYEKAEEIVEEFGYWCLCSKHAQQWRDQKPMPKLKQSAIDREAGRGG
jgi:hypothetical protein